MRRADGVASDVKRRRVCGQTPLTSDDSLSSPSNDALRIASHFCRSSRLVLFGSHFSARSSISRPSAPVFEALNTSQGSDWVNARRAPRRNPTRDE